MIHDLDKLKMMYIVLKNKCTLALALVYWKHIAL